jgi:hypothetical protein
MIFALGAASVVALADRWQRSWGATAWEQNRDLLGDDLIPYPRLQATRAIGIAAPPVDVWPWLVQMGQNRGGFYSYDALENLMGLDIHSADAIHPEWQHLAPGDTVPLVSPDFELDVAVLEPPRTLVLFADGPIPPGRTDDDAPTLRFSWTFAVDPDGPADSRLLIRERYDWDRVTLGVSVWVVGWASYVMTQKMLRGIKARAEAGARAARR